MGAPRRAVRSLSLAPTRLALLADLPQPKSDISDLGHLKVPNSGKPKFGRGRYTAFVAASTHSRIGDLSPGGPRLGHIHRS